jgi:hypothetical protein
MLRANVDVENSDLIIPIYYDTITDIESVTIGLI